MFANLKREISEKALVKALDNMDSIAKIDLLMETAKEWKNENKISKDFYNHFQLDAMKKRMNYIKI